MLKLDKRRISKYIAVIGLLVFLYFTGILKPINNIINKFLNPINSRLYSLSAYIRSTFDDQTDKSNLINTISQLEDQIVKLTEENANYRTVEAENNILRESLGFLKKNNYKYLVCNVISREDVLDFSGRTVTITIDKGSRDGIFPGLGVVSSKGVIVGKVVEVKDDISEVYLTNNTKCKLAATVINQENTNGITEGELGLTIKMKFIPQDKEVKTGDLAITSGLEQGIPRGLVIGRVIKVEKESNELWQNAIIEPLVNPDEIIIVSVLLP
jgi:rod shape-determining protein MreC